jgi:hypothetical protein
LQKYANIAGAPVFFSPRLSTYSLLSISIVEIDKSVRSIHALTRAKA